MRTPIHPSVAAGVQGRTRVNQLLPADPARALEIARAIEHPWYRCQALSAVAEVLSDHSAPAVLASALRSAHELTEPNRIVTVAAWPMRVLVPRRLGNAGEEVARLLTVIAAEPHSLRRADALDHLFGSVFEDPRLRERVLSALLAALAASHGWRSERIWAGVVTRMNDEDPAAAARLLQMMPEGRAKHRATRDLQPRPM